MSPLDSPLPTAYHSHLYYDANTLPQARALCEAVAARFPNVVIGRMHERPVGPHPDWSCQLSFPAADFGTLVPWLALHRGDLVIFTHPLGADEITDHLDHAIWMGAVRPLNLDALR